MGAERQQGTWYQLSLWEGREDGVRHGAGGEGGTRAAACEEPQTPTASERERALTCDLIERISGLISLSDALPAVGYRLGGR